MKGDTPKKIFRIEVGKEKTKEETEKLIQRIKDSFKKIDHGVKEKERF